MEKGAGREEVRKEGKGCQREGDGKGEVVKDRQADCKLTGKSALGRYNRKVLARLYSNVLIERGLDLPPFPSPMLPAPLLKLKLSEES